MEQKFLKILGLCIITILIVVLIMAIDLTIEFNKLPKRVCYKETHIKAITLTAGETYQLKPNEKVLGCEGITNNIDTWDENKTLAYYPYSKKIISYANNKEIKICLVRTIKEVCEIK